MDTEQMHDLMEKHRQYLVEQEISKLRALHAPHYQSIDLNLLQIRAIQLVEAFLNSFSAGPASFVSYLHAVAQERFREGYFLEEIQGALNALGEASWRLVEEKVPRKDQIAVLGRVSATIGAAKDQIARVFLVQLERAETKAARLEKRLNELFTGTVSGPDMEEEDLPDAGKE